MNIGNHHAYVIEGKKDLIFGDLKKYLSSEFRVDEETHPDVFYFEAPSFLVEHAKEVKDMDSKSPFQLSKKIIILSFDSITREAQNALLKVLEEPKESSLFFIVVRSARMFLPTILSRVEIVFHEVAREDVSLIDPKTFASLSYAKRLETIADVLKKLSAEEISRQAVVDTIDALALYMKHQDGYMLHALRTLEYKNDKSASLKLLLERLALC